jgi:hypothetical protein
MHLTVPVGHAVIFTEACLHSGGANESTSTCLDCLRSWLVVRITSLCV